MKLVRVIVIAIVLMLLACLGKTPIPSPMIVIEAQTLPATVKIGVDPPTDNPSGYNLVQDGGTATFVPLPATGTCTDFFTGASSPCVQVSFTFTAAGSHTISIAAVSVGGASSATALTFNLTVPGTPSHPHAVK